MARVVASRLRILRLLVTAFSSYHLSAVKVVGSGAKSVAEVSQHIYINSSKPWTRKGWNSKVQKVALHVPHGALGISGQRRVPWNIIENPGPFDSSLLFTSSNRFDLDSFRRYLSASNGASLDVGTEFDAAWAELLKRSYLNEASEDGKLIESPLDASSLETAVKKVANLGFIKASGVNVKKLSIQGVELRKIEYNNLKDYWNSWPVLSSLQDEVLELITWRSRAKEHFVDKGFNRNWIEKTQEAALFKAAASFLLASISISSELGAFNDMFKSFGIQGGNGSGVASQVGNGMQAMDAKTAEWVAKTSEWMEGVSKNIKLDSPLSAEDLKWFTDLQNSVPNIPDGVAEKLDRFVRDYDKTQDIIAGGLNAMQDNVLHTYDKTHMVIADGVGAFQDTQAWMAYYQDWKLFTTIPIVSTQVARKKSAYVKLKTFTDISQGHLYAVYAQLEESLQTLMIDSNIYPILKHDDNPKTMFPITPAAGNQTVIGALPEGTMLMKVLPSVPNELAIPGDPKSEKCKVTFRTTDGIQSGWTLSENVNFKPAYYTTNSHNKYQLIVYDFDDTTETCEILIDDRTKRSFIITPIDMAFYVRSRRKLACPGCDSTGNPCYCMQISHITCSPYAQPCHLSAFVGRWVCPRTDTPNGMSGLSLVTEETPDQPPEWKIDQRTQSNPPAESLKDNQFVLQWQVANEQSRTLYAARMTTFAVGITAAIGGIVFPPGAIVSGLAVAGMASAGIAGVDALGAGVVQHRAEHYTKNRIEAFLFALAKWEYFLAKSPPTCRITDEVPCLNYGQVTQRKDKKDVVNHVCLRDLVFFNRRGDARPDAINGWCVPSLRTLLSNGMYCTVSKDCLSGFCHFEPEEVGPMGTFQQVPAANDKFSQWFGSGVSERRKEAVARTTGVCRKACLPVGGDCLKIKGASFGYDKEEEFKECVDDNAAGTAS